MSRHNIIIMSSVVCINNNIPTIYWLIWRNQQNKYTETNMEHGTPTAQTNEQTHAKSHTRKNFKSLFSNRFKKNSRFEFSLRKMNTKLLIRVLHTISIVKLQFEKSSSSHSTRSTHCTRFSVFNALAFNELIVSNI